MAQDNIYYFDKETKVRHLLGEIQTNFNFNLVIDGSKDSMQVDVFSFQRDVLEPNTLIYHETTNSWWVVTKDKVERNANEIGYQYTHSITLNGAIDLLNSRDLVDSGYNANNYTIDTFFKKLLKLSNFEYEYQIEYGNNVDKDKKVDYIKSYENYTLLSAIRDFFNSYNCDVKLRFTTRAQQGIGRIINKAIFDIIPRTGNVDLTPIDIGVFGDIRENIDYDKKSFGTTVISNAQNVVSTMAKTYPQVGGVQLTGSDYETSISGAYIKLPSNAWYVNWVKAICPVKLYLATGNDETTTLLYAQSKSRTYLDNNFEKVFQELLDSVDDDDQQLIDDKEMVKGIIQENKEKIRKLVNNSSITFFNNTKYDPRIGDTGEIIKEENTPYLTSLDNADSSSSHRSKKIAVMDKESASLLRDKDTAMVWERGSDKIYNLDFFALYFKTPHFELTDLFNIGYGKVYIYEPIDGVYAYVYAAYDYNGYYGTPYGYMIEYQHLNIQETILQVNYIPMNDLKIKLDNENNTKDIQLYNQNGKLNDSVALSKMVDSYSKEIESPTITRYMEYTNFSNIPSIGQIVMDGTKKYVINNISYNCYPNESNNQDNVAYYFECEFTLSEYVSTKSIMTSPNTNVRDYGIPQKYNIKRRQVYRDYYEIGFSQESRANQSTPYAPLNNYLNFDTNYVKKDYDHTALIEIEYDNEVSGSNYWYYQLNSTVYTMAKSIYEVIDFNDNNIIGYDIQNSTTGFNMSDLWSNQYRAVTTPVSYVDDFGKFLGITLQMVNAQTLASAYSEYLEDFDTGGEAVMLSAHCFIDSDMYGLVESHPINRNSNISLEQHDYEIDPNDPLVYGFTFDVNASDIGIPNNITINSTNIVGVTNIEIYKDGALLSSGYALQVTSTSTTNRTITLTFASSVRVIGHSGHLDIYFNVVYKTTGSIADYIIYEPDYEKDPIEVPVFEYSLQMGDTKEVEIGDEILLQQDCLANMLYSIPVPTSSSATMLNESKYTTQWAIIGGQYDSTNDNRVYNVSSDYYPLITLERNNTRMRIKFYNSQEVEIIGNQDQTAYSFSRVVVPTTGSAQMSKNFFIGKDIIIRKAMIKGVYHDDNENTNELLVDRESTLFIIHRPTENQFEGDDLVLNVNYYKLR